jgi:FkbM family methyltransferase
MARIASAVTPHIPNRVLVRVNRHPQLRRLLREHLTVDAQPGVSQQRVGRGPAKGQRMLLDMGSDERRLVAGTYEPWVHAVLPEIVAPGVSVWDIGAHIGYYVLVAAALSPTGHHVAVEPDPANVERLRANLALNDVSAEIVEAAVSDQSGEVRFDASSELGRIADEGRDVVRAVTLDDLLDVHTPPGVVMMDIEGGEAVAVPAALRLLEEVRPTWLIELHGEHGELAAQTLLDHGYSVRSSGSDRSHALFVP